MTAPGILYGVGVGPGDPELITVKAARLLARVSAVFAPVARPGAESLAAQIARPFLPEGLPVEPLVFAMRSPLPTRISHWQAAATAIAARLDAGGDAAFLTEGDPSLYSTFQHVTACLAAQRPDLRVEVIPGISSVQAVAARAGLPLADNDESLAILPATAPGPVLDGALRSFHTVVVMKAAAALDPVLDTLEAAGLADRAVCVVRCGQPGERVVHDVRTLRGQPLDYFATLMVRTRP